MPLKSVYRLQCEELNGEYRELQSNTTDLVILMSMKIFRKRVSIKNYLKEEKIFVF